MVVVHQPSPHQVLVVLDMLIEASKLDYLHDDKAGQQGDDKQGGIDASLHQDLKVLSDVLITSCPPSVTRAKTNTRLRGRLGVTQR